MEAKRSSIVVVFLVIVSALSATISIITENAVATTRYVGGSGPGNYTAIQDAINAAIPGDTVYVFKGTYAENILVDKSLSLIGEDRNATTIDGGGSVDVVNVTANWVNISGFTMTNTGMGWADSGIELFYVRDCRIVENNVSDNTAGIFLYHSDYNVVSNNNAANNQVGIELWFSSHNVVANNSAWDNEYGVHLWQSENNTVIDNSAYLSNRHGIDVGMSRDNMVNHNIVFSNQFCGIKIDRSERISITNNTAFNNEDGLTFRESTDNTITGNTMFSNRRNGVYSDHSDNLTITNNNISSSNWSGVEVYFSDNIVLTGNKVSNSLVGIAVSYSTAIVATNNVMVENGVFINGRQLVHWNTHTIDTTNSVNGRPLYYWKNSTGGTIPAGAGQVILANCTNVLVENQNLSNASVGIEVALSENNTLVNNSVSNDELVGVWVISSDNNTIASNSISENGEGVFFFDSTDNTISNNGVSSNEWNGVYLFFSSNRNTITGNTVLSNNWDGIHLSTSENNTITGNTASSNSQAGIVISSSSNNTAANNSVLKNGVGITLQFESNNNTIANNTVWDNLEGIYITFPGPDYNRIYHNSIVENGRQGHDEKDTNQWDDDYPSGGNYWSDYNGVDVKGGPNQDLPGSDGIGDTPYIIDMNSYDRYPLMSPLIYSPTRPPSILQADLNGNVSENVTITWALSSDDGMGFKSVAGYRIYRNSTYDSKGLGYQLISSIPSGVSTFVDNYAGDGDPNIYFYKLCAVDLNNNTSCSTGQAAKYTRPLSKGPNLVSIPLIQSDESIQTVLQTLSYDNAWSYDPINQEWKSFSKSKLYGQSLEYLNHTMGIWVNVTQDSNLTVAGVVPTSTTIDLQAGWNLVGFPSFDDNYTVADLKAAVAVERIEGFDALAPPYFLRVIADGDLLQAGFGYWIRVNTATDWTVDNT